MIKRILFPIAGSSSVESGLSTALTVTVDHYAHLDVVFYRRPFNTEIHLSVDDYDMTRLMNASKSFERNEKQRVHDARKQFNLLTENREVPYEQYPSSGNTPAAGWEVSTGAPSSDMAHRAVITDLVVVGRSTNSVGDVTRSLVESALFACGQPVLVAPRVSPMTIGKRVLVAWNRSASSAHAVRSALPLMRHADAVTLFMIETGAKAGPEPDELAGYLSLHGVAAEVKLVPQSGAKVSATLLKEAAEMSADLMVMGAFSHSRLREFVLGGVTKDILAAAEVPVLMSH
jgi:nucleotide-binding universal stress UspA family protein